MSALEASFMLVHVYTEEAKKTLLTTTQKSRLLETCFEIFCAPYNYSNIICAEKESQTISYSERSYIFAKWINTLVQYVLPK